MTAYFVFSYAQWCWSAVMAESPSDAIDRTKAEPTGKHIVRLAPTEWAWGEDLPKFVPPSAWHEMQKQECLKLSGAIRNHRIG